MKISNLIKWTFIFSALYLFINCASTSQAQYRQGGLESGSISGKVLVSNGPGGPIHGGESAVTGMVLMDDGWVYGSTEATWGASVCHLFRTDGENVEHVFNVTSRLPGQVKISAIAAGPDNTLICATTTYNKILDEGREKYEGGHLFSFDPETNTFIDYGIISYGQGLNCAGVDTLHTCIYCVTCPGGHLFSYNYTTEEKKDYGEIMKPWRIKDLDMVSWRGIPKVLMIDDTGTVYFSTYVEEEGGRIFRLAYGDEKPVFTGAVVPTQKGMHNDPLYENTIASAIRAKDGGFWCGTSVDGFLFKFYPSTSTVINKGKSFNYWNLHSLAYGGDGRLYMLGGRDYDNPWLLCYDHMTGSIECLGWPDHTIQCSIICADKKGRILIAENMRNSFIWVYEKSKAGWSK